MNQTEHLADFLIPYLRKKTKEVVVIPSYNEVRRKLLALLEQFNVDLPAGLIEGETSQQAYLMDSNKRDKKLRIVREFDYGKEVLLKMEYTSSIETNIVTISHREDLFQNKVIVVVELNGKTVAMEDQDPDLSDEEKRINIVNSCVEILYNDIIDGDFVSDEARIEQVRESLKNLGFT